MHLLVLISADLVLGGTIFPEGGHYSPVNNVLGGQYSPVNNVQGDIFRGDTVHYDTVIANVTSTLGGGLYICMAVTLSASDLALTNLIHDNILN